MHMLGLLGMDIYSNPLFHPMGLTPLQIKWLEGYTHLRNKRLKSKSYMQDIETTQQSIECLIVIHNGVRFVYVCWFLSN